MSVVRSLGDRDVRCVVVTGADPAFCSGDDVKLIMAGRERPTDALATAPRLTPAADTLLHTDVPVIAAVNGAAPGLGRLAQLVGRERAAELLFTGEVIDAATAGEIGLVSRVVAHDELVPTATERARRIAANPPLAVQSLKQGLRQALDPLARARLAAKLLASPSEFAAAASQRRSPTWQPA